MDRPIDGRRDASERLDPTENASGPPEDPGLDPWGDDRTSEQLGVDRHLVHPYRDAREALEARRHAILDELAAVARVERRKDELQRRLAAVEEQLEARTPEGPIDPPTSTFPPVRAASWFACGALTAGSLAICTLVTVLPPRSAPSVVYLAPPSADLMPPAAAEPPGKPEPAPRPPAIQRVGPPRGELDIDRHIRWIAPLAWEVDRVYVEQLLEESQRLRQSYRVIPHERDGRVVGVRVYGVRRVSVPGFLGLQNGDTLIDINGYSVADPERALEAYTQLRTADALFVRLERRGEERLHVYRIVD